MSLKSLIKRIFRTAEANITHGLDKLNSTEKRLLQVAYKISDEIHRLEVARLEVVRTISQCERDSTKNLTTANEREEALKQAIARGATPMRSEAMIILHRRRVGNALKARAQELEETVKKLNSAIIQLGDRFDEVRGDLELVKVQKETQSLGVALPEDVEYQSNMINIDVDDMIRGIDISGKPNLDTGATSLEADNYLASLVK